MLNVSILNITLTFQFFTSLDENDVLVANVTHAITQDNVTDINY